MRVGWIGAGKLGLPCAAVLAQHHDVSLFDTDDTSAMNRLTDPPAWEEGLRDLLNGDLHLGYAGSNWGELRHAELTLIAVPTPHEPQHDGTKYHVPGLSADFNYDALKAALRVAAEHAPPGTPIGVVSTVAPGTNQRHGLDKLAGDHPYVYHPSFIAMGTTIRDYENPEVRIFGLDPDAPAWVDYDPVGAFDDLYLPIDGHKVGLAWMSVAEAELTKMIYNTWIGMKIGFGNTVAQLADATGADADVVIRALGRCTDRVNSWKYTKPGMGDGGACHPRDQIVLAWLADHLGLGGGAGAGNLFDAIIDQRQAHAGWLADIAIGAHNEVDDDTRPLVILGYAYKPDSALTYGSPALLLAHILEDYDPGLIDTTVVPQDGPEEKAITVPSTVIIGCAHRRYATMRFPEGSTIIDPFGIVQPQDDVELIRPGRRPGDPAP